MVPPRADGSRSRWPRRLATAVEDFRQVSRAEVEPADEARQFYRLTPGKKMIVMTRRPADEPGHLPRADRGPAADARRAARRRDHEGRLARQVRRAGDLAERERRRRARPTRRSRRPTTVLQPGDRVLAVDGIDDHQLEPARVHHRAVGRQAAVDGDRAQGHQTHVSHHAGAQPQVRQRHLETTTKEAGYLGVSPVNRHYYDRARHHRRARADRHQVNLGVHALGQYPQKIGSLWQHRLRRQAARPAGRRRASSASAASPASSPRARPFDAAGQDLHADRPARERQPAAVLLQPAAAAAAGRRPRRRRDRRGGQARPGPAAGPRRAAAGRARRATASPGAEAHLRRHRARCCRSCTPSPRC